MTRDALAAFYVHDVILNRYGSASTAGPGLGADEPFRGFVSFGVRMVRGMNGDEVVSTAQIAGPRSLGYVKPQSVVTLPSIFGGGTRTVVGCEVGDDGGTLPLPAHVVLMLE